MVTRICFTFLTFGDFPKSLFEPLLLGKGAQPMPFICIYDICIYLYIIYTNIVHGQFSLPWNGISKKWEFFVLITKSCRLKCQEWDGLPCFFRSRIHKKHIPSTCHEYTHRRPRSFDIFQCKFARFVSLVSWSNTFSIWPIQWAGHLCFCCSQVINKNPAESFWLRFPIRIGKMELETYPDLLVYSISLWKWYGQISLRPHTSFRPPNGGFVMEIPLFQGSQAA